MSGSTALGEPCSKSSTHDDLVWAMERMAFLAGRKMRAVGINGGWRGYPARLSPWPVTP